MNLLLDLGNSHCKFALLEGGVIKEHGVCSYPDANKTSVIDSLLSAHKVIDKIVVCSVLDDKFTSQLTGLFNSYAIDDCYFLNPATRTFGIQLSYQTPGCLGADRLAAMIAANERFSGNKCIVDCGTAITIDALDANAVHHGGVILPGFASMRQALSADTDIKRNKNEPAGSFNIFSNTTHDAMYTGCLSAVVGGIQQVANAMKMHRDSFDHVIITGGDAELIMPMLTQRVEHDPKLVLDGLMVVMRNI